MINVKFRLSKSKNVQIYTIKPKKYLIYISSRQNTAEIVVWQYINK